eukprot:Plantae.Rhodophyta-Purpureofilum_apyrenoidigerum.ctg14687.p1 GENE.Plantae.Rhodophyta-Purpureofilum_apyrenoidigerum.ctg14687~~Plantae.Rhodophyta-Purpureofilum_apyrenoidigerum.ctg14687.p1  ORF type:complete len:691 (+),score=158.11 Plantae.Rhodophyta-Purpureofilum_apyrenoidigerum.ctg14687:85-2073(+)
MADRTDFLSKPATDCVAKPGETHPRVHPQLGVYEQPFDDRVLKNTYDVLLSGIKESNGGPFLGYRANDATKEFQWYSYPEVHEMAVTLGVALKNLGLKHGDAIGIYSANSPNVTIIDIACASQGIIVVPLYDSLSPGAVKYILDHAEVKVAFVQDLKLPKITEIMDTCSALMSVVVMGNRDLKGVGTYEPREKLLSLAELMSKGAYDVAQVNPSSPEEIAMVMYTSGTTGNPKGVLLKSKTFVAAVASGYRFLGKSAGAINKTDSMLSYLPLAHIFGQSVEKTFMLLGGRIGYWQGDIRLLLEDLMELKPTVFFGVPRVYARFEQKIRETLEGSSFLKKKLFSFAYKTQLHYLNNFQSRSDFLDKLIFSKVKEKLLPNVRFSVTGAAPMSSDTNDFLKVVLCSPVCQGYGLTETCSVSCCSPPHKLGEAEMSMSGNVGGPMNGYVKLVDVPEMNYLSTDQPFPRGEIVLKGPTTFCGYYKNEEATREVLTPDGWFSTGDIGTVLPDGSFRIIDRKKNLFKLAQGEYVSPEHLEGELVKCKLVGQLWVYGNSFERMLVGIVVPDKDQWLNWAKTHGKSSNLEELAKDPQLKKEVLAQLKEKREHCGFRNFEDIVDVRFMTELNDLGQGFHVDNDLMTPTFKLKRNKLRDRFQPQLDEMYAAQK